MGEEFIDFKVSLLDIFGHLFQGTLLIMGALKAEEMNEEAESEPPFELKYQYNMIAGIYTFAL